MVALRMWLLDIWNSSARDHDECCAPKGEEIYKLVPGNDNIRASTFQLNPVGWLRWITALRLGSTQIRLPEGLRLLPLQKV